MSYNPYHWCIVNKCRNTTVKTPGKLWIKLPKEIKMRNTWLKLAQRDPSSLSVKSELYLCEEHFDVSNSLSSKYDFKIKKIFSTFVHLNT